MAKYSTTLFRMYGLATSFLVWRFCWNDLAPGARCISRKRAILACTCGSAAPRGEPGSPSIAIVVPVDATGTYCGGRGGTACPPPCSSSSLEDAYSTPSAFIAGMNALDRLREQRAQRLLALLQDDLRAQMRQEDEDAGRRGVQRKHAPRNAQQKLQREIARLAAPATREQVWNRVAVPTFQGVAINDLPKTRAFWARVDVTRWTRAQLDAACALLDLPGEGKKAELVARVQDWVHAPALRAAREQQELADRAKERVLALAGRVFACGHNFHGELGLGHRGARRVPTELETLRGEHVTRVVAGFDADFAFALAADGRVFAWGGGGRAAFDGGAACAPVAPLPPSPGKPTPVFQKSPQHQDASDGTPDSATPCFLLPHEVPQLQGQCVTSIVCARSDGHVAFTTAPSGACFTWGRNDHGELGVLVADESARSAAPVRVTAFNVPAAQAAIAQVSVGHCHSAAVTRDGDLFTWGACWSGQLGLGVARRKGVRDARQQLFFPTPTPVEAFVRTRVVKVSCGAAHTAVISREGQLFTFGCSDGGRLGHGMITMSDSGDAVDVLHPELVKALEKDVVVDVVCSSWHSLCLVQPRGDDSKSGSHEGFVYAFGHGIHGQLGLGKQKIASIPTRLPEFVHRKLRCRAIAASSHHSCALSSDGKLFTWGQNTAGCLGREPPDGAMDACEPDVVADFSGFGIGPIVSIACGHRFTLFATGPWEPLEPAPTFELHERLNRHARVPLKSPVKARGGIS